MFPDGNLANHVNDNDAAAINEADPTPRYNARFLPWLPGEPPASLADPALFAPFGGVITHPSPQVSDLVFTPRWWPGNRYP